MGDEVNRLIKWFTETAEMLSIPVDEAISNFLEYLEGPISLKDMLKTSIIINAIAPSGKPVTLKHINIVDTEAGTIEIRTKVRNSDLPSYVPSSTALSVWEEKHPEDYIKQYIEKESSGYYSTYTLFGKVIWGKREIRHNDMQKELEQNYERIR